MSFSVFETTSQWSTQAGLPVVSEKIMTSTHELAKVNAFEEKEALSLYVADHQTKGRGRGANTWTEGGDGHYLLSSWSFLSRSAPQPVLAPALGLAVFKAAIATWLGQPFALKAPNDLYLGTQKVAGLLIENVQEGTHHRLIVSLGMNVTKHPGVDRSGALSDQIPASEISPEIWRQFLDRLLLEFTATLLMTGNTLQDVQRRGLLFALNLFPDRQGQYRVVSPDGSLQTQAGENIAWSSL